MKKGLSIDSPFFCAVEKGCTQPEKKREPSGPLFCFLLTDQSLKVGIFVSVCIRNVLVGKLAVVAVHAACDGR